MTRDEYGRAYEKGFPLTVRLLLSRGAHVERARECAQAAWVRGWEHLSQLRDDRLVVSWVNSIAINTYRSVLRTEPVWLPLPEIRTYPRMNFAALDVAGVLKLCRPYDRGILQEELRGMTVKEMACAHGITETAVRIRMLRARRSARARVQARSRIRQAIPCGP